MKAWIVRFVSLYVFNVVVLLLMGLLPGVSVGFAALWGAVILTAATIWIKPLVTRWFGSMAATSASERTRAGEKVVQFGLVFAVELVVWILVVLLSGVRVSGWFWGWILPPVALLIAWIIYDAIDDRIEAGAGHLYDRATAGRSAHVETDAGAPAVPTAPAAPTAQTREARDELKDGLTAEQRRMLDEL